MPEDPLLVRVQGVWEELASAPVSFGALGDVDVVASPESRICPPGWAGIVLLGGALLPRSLPGRTGKWSLPLAIARGRAGRRT